MATPFFSIIIPTLNEDEYLPLLLEDLTKQTITDFTVTVVDGNSDDQTQRIVRSYASRDARFKLITSRKRNAAAQRNLGAKKSSGTYYLFLDADNRIPPHYIEGLHYYAVRNNPEFYTTWSVPDSENINDRIAFRALNLALEGSIKIGMPVAFAACMICRKDVFQTVQGFTEQATYAEDIDLARKITAKGYQFYVLRDPVYTYSLRRFRKEGTLTMLRKITPTMLKVLVTSKAATNTNDVYPMLGGKYFTHTDEKPSPASLRQIRAVLSIFKQLAKQRAKSMRAFFNEMVRELSE